MIKKKLFILLFICSALTLSAQNSILPNEGKMLTTVAVLVAILVGIFLFLFLLERRLTKLENQINDES